MVFLVGKKISDYTKKFGIKVEKQFAPLAESMSYDLAMEISDMMVDLFLSKKVDRVELVFNHFKNAGVQVPSREVMLPLKTVAQSDGTTLDYIVEPDKETFVNDLIPKVIRTNFYSVMLDTLTAEHGARMTAMHIASDNADQLSQELKIQYNKARQNVITNELIDIVGGAEALNG
jgi:F-type H+-transporting ATPase subunit gamma